jgi:hypothetical protein
MSSICALEDGDILDEDGCEVLAVGDEQEDEPEMKWR